MYIYIYTPRSADIIIIKASCTGSSEKNKIVYKFLSQPHKHLRHRKLKNQIQGSNQQLTVSFSIEQFGRLALEIEGRSEVRL